MKKKFIIWILVFILAVGCGLGIYFIVANSKTQISVSSYDGVSSLNFDLKLKKTEIRKSEHAGICFKYNYNEFVKDYIDNTDLNAKTISLSDDAEAKLINVDKYNFIVFKDGEYVSIENMVTFVNGYYVIPFVSIGEFLFDEVVLWSEINNTGLKYLNLEYQNYEDLKSFYETINSDYVQFDDLTQTINLKSYKFRGYTSSNRLSADFDVSIKCSSNGILVEKSNFSK